jgi:acetylserotonin N-methyltransferase
VSSVIESPPGDSVALRPVSEHDLPMPEDLTQDQEQTGEFEWFGWWDLPRWRQGWEENRLIGPDGGTLAVTCGSDRLGLVNWRRHPVTKTAYCFEIGIILLPHARGRGYGTQAQRMLTRYLFAHPPVHRVFAGTDADNVAEQRALEKAGFTREGVHRGTGWRDLLAPSSDARDIWEIYLSPTWLPTLLAADELGILVSIADAPGSAEEVADRLGLNGRALSSVLTLLASLGYLVPRGGRYHVSDSARQHLLPSSPLYWGGVWNSMRQGSPLYARLRDVLTTEDPVEEIPAGSGDGNVDGWASGAVSPEEAASVAKYMHSHSAAAAIGVARSDLFTSTRRLLDVGGCSGVFSIALAERHPELSCTIMDLPTVCELTPGYVKERGLENRIDTHPADMFREPWPLGYDAVFLSNMFHDWRPVTCLGLARHAFDVLPPGGTINLHEMLLNDDGSGPRTAAAFSVLMAISTQGQQFTFGQLETLLVQAGFANIECHPTSPVHSLVRGRKP